MRKITVWLCLFIVVLSLCAAPSARAQTSAPAAVRGVLDLSGWHWEQDGLVALNGEWEWYWSRLLTPAELAAGTGGDALSYTRVPQVWQGQTYQGSKLSGDGYATYRLVIRTADADTGKDVALYMPSVATAYKLWIDGKEAATSGTVGTNRETMTPTNVPKPVFFHLSGSETEIVIQVSNFVQRKGGLWEPIRMGSADAVTFRRELSNAIELLIVGSLFTMGLYHLGLFVARRKDRASLYFGCLCLAIGVRTAVTGQTLAVRFAPGLPWEWQTHLEYLSVSLGVLMFVLYVAARYPVEMRPVLRRPIVAILLLYSCFIAFTPARIYTHSMLAFQLAILALFAYIGCVFVLAFVRKREGAFLNLLAMSVFFVTALNDTLFYNQVLSTGDSVQFGMMFYVLMQAVDLSHRFSKSFAHVEKLSSELQRWNESLEGKVRERTEALEMTNASLHEANRELVKMEQSRRHLLSNISHELGTPLTLIQGYIKAVLDRVDEPNRDRYLQLSYDKTLILNRIIGDLFELSKFEAGKIRFDCQFVHPVPFVRALYEKYEWTVKQDGYSFEFIDLTAGLSDGQDEEDVAWIDVVRIEQVVVNLLFNARKFTPADGTIQISVERVGPPDHGQSAIRVSVQDTGFGIDEEDLPFVFDRFYRGKNSRKNRSAGTGLGLAICKEIMEHHGGTIGVNSRVGSGSTFFFTLPLSDDPLNPFAEGEGAFREEEPKE
ncbi:ATP-binding protein [Paenibacillus elgii]|uniref:sensor histidine kinase n=1 Tax=Paenibacillus elgii TaxID=189691 RepID=UPI002D7C03C5|nr:ATP-binding protein [Paenibacillus elgii]